MNVRTKFEVRTLPVPEIIAIEVFGGELRTFNLGKGT